MFSMSGNRSEGKELKGEAGKNRPGLVERVSEEGNDYQRLARMGNIMTRKG